MSMEERIAKGEMPAESVNDIKAALMGPALRYWRRNLFDHHPRVAAGIAIFAGFAGQRARPHHLPAALQHPAVHLRVWGIHKGYEIGVSLLATAEESGIMDKVIKAAVSSV